MIAIGCLPYAASDSGQGAISYEWQLNSVSIGGATNQVIINPAAQNIFYRLKFP